MFKTLKNDLPAWLAVFLVAVPLCLGIAVASGAPLLSWLIAGIIWWIVIGLWSSSHLSVSWPAAWLVAVVVTAIAKLGFASFLTALMIAGLIQIILWLTWASKVSKYIPTTVIKWMLAAIGMTLILKQLPAMIGTWSLSFNSLHSIAVNILIIGVVSLLVLIGREKWFSKKFQSIPGSLIAVVIGTALAFAYQWAWANWGLNIHQFVSLPTNIHGLQDFWLAVTHPSTADLANKQLYIIAITIALVASIETILSIQAIDKLDPMQRGTALNQEMVVQGIANMTSWFLGWLPVTSVIVRSSVNLHAGAKSKMSAVLHGIALLLALLFAANYINMIPMAVLAAILVYTGYHLTSPSKFIEKYKAWRWEFIPFVTTFVVILIQDLLVWVLVWIVVYYVMWTMKRENRSIIKQLRKDKAADLVDFED